jgi:trehalose 6-phosphate phosphatase
MKSSSETTNARELLAPLRDRPDRAVVSCDIDGTIAPIVARPEDASVPASTRELLANLQRRYALVICLSGRRAADARRVVGIGSLDYIGNHGLERLRPGAGPADTQPAAASHKAAVRGFAAETYSSELRKAGIRLEDKDAIWSFHWREAADPVAAEAVLQDVAAAAKSRGLVPHWGRKVLEIRPPIAFDKGTALADALDEVDAEAALYGGDDSTDLDAFRKLRELSSIGKLKHAVCVGVTSDEGPPKIADEADLVVEGPDGFRELLAALL